MKIRNKHVLFTSVVCLVFWVNSLLYPQQSTEIPIYKDHTQSFEDRVDDLLSRMTIAEKVSQMMSRSPNDLIRFGMVRHELGGGAIHSPVGGVNTTIFPVGIARASTWNRELLYEIGTAASDEIRAQFNTTQKQVLTFWAPVVEMARDPRWGRNEECFGEDPYLTSQLTLPLVKGVYGNHPKYIKAVAAPKHFVANNEEWNRHNGSANIDEQLLHEYYLKPYKVLVKEGNVASIMAAYNRLNGVPCQGNKELLTDILRDQWGFTGYVVTDCEGIQDFYLEGKGHKYVATVQEAISVAINAGIDMECGGEFKHYLYQVIESGAISEEAIDRAVRRILLTRFRLGLYDPPEMVPFSKIPHSVIDSKEHRALARKVAQEAIILLKNSEDLLPLDKDQIKSVAVIGPNADVCHVGEYTGITSLLVSPLDGIKNKIGNEKVKFAKGTSVKIECPVIPAEYLFLPDETGDNGLLGEYFDNTTCSGDPVFTRVDSVLDFDFGLASPDNRLENNYYSVRWTGKFKAPVSGPYYIGGEFDDAIRLYFDGRLIIDKTKNRNMSSAVAKVELDKGKYYDLKIEFTEHWYKSKLKLWGAPPKENKFLKAVEIAKSSDVAIVVAGTDATVEKEGVDRSDLQLPGDQLALIKAVYKANPKTIVVLQNGSPLAINWVNDNVPAIIETFYNGEEGGNALADVVFGDYNPAGRLPMTVYKSVNQLPDFSDYDIRKGRTYMYNMYPDGKKIQPLYPFGYGLSYTTFEYGNLKLESKTISNTDSLKASMQVTNTGSRAGDEVVQLYIRDKKASVQRPVKQLAGFERVSLDQGETKTVSFTVPSKDLAFWDVKTKSWIVEPGEFDMLIGDSSSNILIKETFLVE